MLVLLLQTGEGKVFVVSDSSSHVGEKTGLEVLRPTEAVRNVAVVVWSVQRYTKRNLGLAGREDNTGAPGVCAVRSPPLPHEIKVPTVKTLYYTVDALGIHMLIRCY